MSELNKKGFTLVELIVAIALLSVALFGIAGLFSSGIATARRSEKLSTAVFLAQEQIERIIAAPYLELDPGEYEPRHDVFETFERATAVELIDPDTLEPSPDDLDLKRITVTVFYPTAQGERLFSLATIVTRQ